MLYAPVSTQEYLISITQSAMGPSAGLLKHVKHSLHFRSVIFYGVEKNPYRFIRNADLFLPPSHHGAAPLVFTDAKCLGLPILATRTASVQELILDNQAGWVCDHTLQAICQSLKTICRNPDMLR